MLDAAMAPTRAIKVLGRLFQRPPAPSDEELVSYVASIRPALDRAERLYEQWFEHVALLDDSEKLANVAAIHRWEVATMGQALAGVTPPPIFARPHAEIVASLTMASRAAQLLSNGSRFHTANAVCDGQTLLEASRRRRLTATQTIRRVLEQRQVSWDEHEGTPERGELVTPERAPEPASR